MKAVVLDRDGVLNFDSNDFVKSWKEFVWIPRVREALSVLFSNGWRLFIVSNQSGINRGIMSEEAVREIHEGIKMDLAKSGVLLESIFYCPHRPDEECSCRKPQQGMFLELLERFPVEPERSWMIGDKLTDLIPAEQLGFRTILLHSPLRAIPENLSKVCAVKNDLYEAAQHIIEDDNP